MDKEKIYSMCSEGNVLKVIEYLNTLSKDDYDVINLKKQYEERFLTKTEIYKINSNDPWIVNVINSYFDYFCDVLINKPIEDSEKKLIMNLSKLINSNKTLNLDKIESKLEEIFKKKGYSFLGGVTLPYSGPYIWKTTLKKDFHVSLIDKKQDVTVYFISDFLMLSWMDFATFGNRHTGGWAKEEGIYGSETIDINSNKFQVWFLKHEAQHLSDYKRFPNLNARTLEYRAKLVELIYNCNPHKLIEKFKNEARNDKNLPHPYAEYSIIKNLSNLIFKKEYVNDNNEWLNLNSNVICEGALQLYLQNNKILNKEHKVLY